MIRDCKHSPPMVRIVVLGWRYEVRDRLAGGRIVGYRAIRSFRAAS